ncbi:unnamed protein product [Allacma fusca]|uniref:G-protein coupled receptors family 1 profile domain-containing protein n=1 Tax=Allacma fusca TaxID=39272 RepID=A0A8J2LB56_9HEXA|nr:unnamed protein product [Allacma fusca]
MSRRASYSLPSVEGSEDLCSLSENSRTLDSMGGSNIHMNFSDCLVNSTGWNNVTSDAGDISLDWTDFALVFLFCCIIAGTVIGNTLVIAAVATTRRLRTVTNCFVMSLAVADWLVGMFVMPPKVGLHLVDNKWHLGRILCELWISLDILLCTASILSLCAISIDRYLAITRPLAYSRKRRSKRLALSMISCVWVAAVVITSPPIFGWSSDLLKRQFSQIFWNYLEDISTFRIPTSQVGNREQL